MKRKSILGMLMMTALLGVGMNIHHPVTPTLFTSMGLPSRIFGTSYAAMCFFSFATSPFWGEMSDTIGRVKTFMFSCLGYGLAQLTLGISSSELTVLLSRSLAGMFAAGASIASMAYVADLYQPDQRGRGMSIYIAVQSVSLAAGYLVGGILGSISVSLAFRTQGSWMILLGLACPLLFAETLQDRTKVKVKALFQKVNPFSSFLRSRRFVSAVSLLFFVAVVFSSFGSTAYDNAFNYYLTDQLHFIPAYNGIIKAIVGIIGLAANFTINLWILRQRHVRGWLAGILGLCATFALGALFSQYTVLFLLSTLAFYTVNAIYQPLVQTLAVEKRKSEEIGIVMGLVNALKNLGSVAGSLSAGFVYDLGAVLPFLTAALMFFLAFGFSWMYAKCSKE